MTRTELETDFFQNRRTVKAQRHAVKRDNGFTACGRDRVNTKVMKDPRLAAMMDPKKLPFDGKRMFWGGFKVMIDV